MQKEFVQFIDVLNLGRSEVDSLQPSRISVLVQELLRLKEDQVRAILPAAG
jgi:hypothetical protein